MIITYFTYPVSIFPYKIPATLRDLKNIKLDTYTRIGVIISVNFKLKP